MRESIASPSTNPATVGKFADEQTRNRLTWGIVPDDEMAAAAMHVVHIVQRGGTTQTFVNPLDPATVSDTAQGWLERPADAGRLCPAGRLW